MGADEARAMAQEIARRDKVLYITLDADVSTELRMFSPRENMWVLELPRMPMPTTDNPEEMRRVFESNHAKMTEIMRGVVSELGIDLDQTYLLLDNDMPLSSCLADILSARLAMFYHTDHALPEWISPCRALDGQGKINRVDITITNNPKKTDDLRQTNPRTYNIGKGVDLTGYDIERIYLRPADIADIQTPIVGLAGTVSSLFLSPNLVFSLALALPDVTIVLLGSPDPLIARHAIHSLGNVRFVGAKSSEELPSYIAAFDVCVEPSINSHPNSFYRSAIVESLALGKTVVCSDVEHARPFGDYVTVAHDETDFVDKITDALHTRIPWSLRYKRVEFARSFSWPAVVERLYSVIFS